MWILKKVEETSSWPKVACKPSALSTAWQRLEGGPQPSHLRSVQHLSWTSWMVLSLALADLDGTYEDGRSCQSLVGKRHEARATSPSKFCERPGVSIIEERISTLQLIVPVEGANDVRSMRTTKGDTSFAHQLLRGDTCFKQR